MENTAVIAQDNVQRVKEGLDFFMKGNIEEIVNRCTDDVVWGLYKVPGLEPSGSRYGKDGVREFFTRLSENIHHLVFRADEFISQGDRVVVFGHQTATVIRTGKSFDHDWCMSFTIRDGKTARYCMFIDSHDQWLATQ